MILAAISERQRWWEQSGSQTNRQMSGLSPSYKPDVY
jgi:hypothetical protein